MKKLTNAEWEHLYRTVWKIPFAHLPKEIRGKLVRGCVGKTLYESREEALPVIAEMPVHRGYYLMAYFCPLCKSGFHVGNSRTPNTMPERAIDPKKGKP
jgi:hypothetical protein